MSDTHMDEYVHVTLPDTHMDEYVHVRYTHG